MLALTNVIDNRWAPSFHLLTAVLVSALLLGVLFRQAALGRTRDWTRPRWGVVCAGRWR
ncbi:hypothetical protein ACR6C2_22960 [Streptomyces sp. INA 01156]